MPSVSGVPIRLRLAIDWAFKGTADGEVAILDTSLQATCHSQPR